MNHYEKLQKVTQEHTTGIYTGAYGPVHITNSQLNDLVYTLLRENCLSWIAHHEGRPQDAQQHAQAYHAAKATIFNDNTPFTPTELTQAFDATD